MQGQRQTCLQELSGDLKCGTSAEEEYNADSATIYTFCYLYNQRNLLMKYHFHIHPIGRQCVWARTNHMGIGI